MNKASLRRTLVQ